MFDRLLTFSPAERRLVCRIHAAGVITVSVDSHELIGLRKRQLVKERPGAAELSTDVRLSDSGERAWELIE